MVEAEVITALLIVAVGVLTTAALYVGLMGMLGGLYVVRCPSCAHWTFSLNDTPERDCRHCRHPMLLHPLRTVSSSRPVPVTHSRWDPRNPAAHG